MCVLSGSNSNILVLGVSVSGSFGEGAKNIMDLIQINQYYGPHRPLRQMAKS